MIRGLFSCVKTKGVAEEERKIGGEEEEDILKVSFCEQQITKK